MEPFADRRVAVGSTENREIIQENIHRAGRSVEVSRVEGNAFHVVRVDNVADPERKGVSGSGHCSDRLLNSRASGDPPGSAPSRRFPPRALRETPP